MPAAPAVVPSIAVAAPLHAARSPHSPRSASR